MKDQPKHTPGDWHAECANEVTGYTEWSVIRDGCKHAIASDITDPDTGQASESNARLISAAPDLLEALKDALEHIPMTLQGRALAAIAKAEGREV